jgi:hypothetical protein
MNENTTPVEQAEIVKSKLPQQSINLLRQVLSMAGWEPTTGEFYIAGRLLATKLPDVDITWLKSEEEVKNLSSDAKKEYNTADKIWASTVIEFDELTKKEIEVVRKCLEKMCKHMGNGKYSFALFDFFGFKPE